MFKCIKDWFMGNSPDYKGMADKIAEQTYREDLVETKLPGEDGAYINVPVSSNSFEHLNAMPGLFPLSPDQIDRSDSTTQIKADSEYRFVKVMWFQHRHDQTYHTDIANMPMMAKINHLNNHLVKYMSRYNKYQLTGTTNKELIVDALICCISALSALHYNPKEMTLPDFFLSQRILSLDEIDVEIGRISKVLEDWDHIEIINYREELVNSFTMLTASLLNVYYLNVGKSFILNDYQPRLNDIKHKHPFHEFFLAEGKVLMDVERVKKVRTSVHYHHSM